MAARFSHKEKKIAPGWARIGLKLRRRV